MGQGANFNISVGLHVCTICDVCLCCVVDYSTIKRSTDTSKPEGSNPSYAENFGLAPGQQIDNLINMHTCQTLIHF